MGVRHIVRKKKPKIEPIIEEIIDNDNIDIDEEKIIDDYINDYVEHLSGFKKPINEDEKR